MVMISVPTSSSYIAMLVRSEWIVRDALSTLASSMTFESVSQTVKPDQIYEQQRRRIDVRHP